MSEYTEKDVKNIAFANFLKLVRASNESLGEKFVRQQDLIRAKALQNIQVIGVHEYAKQVLKRNSAAREELMDAIVDGLS